MLSEDLLRLDFNSNSLDGSRVVLLLIHFWVGERSSAAAAACWLLPVDHVIALVCSRSLLRC